MLTYRLILFSILIISSFINAEWLQRSVSSLTPSTQKYTASTWLNNGVGDSNGTVIAVGAGGSGYVLQSNDYGLTWKRISNSSSFTSLYCVDSARISGKTAGYSGLIYTSINNGTTWTQIASAESDSPSFHWVVME
jgi:photosystem II stability/assembly factor-like uncharacterized protein